MAAKGRDSITTANVSGFRPWGGAILKSFAMLTIVYAATHRFVATHGSSFEPAPQFCKETEEGKPCSRPDLFAFQVAGFIMQVFMGLSGLLSWHGPRKIRTPETPEGRLFGYLPDADQLNAGIFVYQTWDFFFSLSIPEHATAVFLAHHAAAALLAYFSLEFQMVHYYGIFYGGCSEISSIFLVFCDFDVYFPASRGSVWGGFILFCQASFVLLFLAYRVIGWWVVTYQMWSDILYILRKGTAESYRPGKSWFLYFSLPMSIALGMLQLYWFVFGMLPKIAEILQV